MESLTPREKKIYDMLILGCTRREMGLEMGISKETVKNHAHKVYIKTGTYDQLDLIFKHYNLPRWKPDETPQT